MEGGTNKTQKRVSNHLGIFKLLWENWAHSTRVLSKIMTSNGPAPKKKMMDIFMTAEMASSTTWNLVAVETSILRSL